MQIEHGRGVGGKQAVKGTKSSREGKRERELERGESRKGDLINSRGRVGEREREISYLSNRSLAALFLDHKSTAHAPAVIPIAVRHAFSVPSDFTM